ncbi:MAG TPA: glycosyltransferase [Gemmatimonadales bacterium]|nr:glycosyltransferase [Gemmatimonadales bacterium]
MKVVHLIDHMGLGGQQLVVRDLATAHAADVEPAVWALSRRELPGTAERFAAASVPYCTLGLSRTSPLALAGLRRALRDARPDVLHLHLEYATLFGTLAALSLAAPRPLLVASLANDPHRHSSLHRRAGRLLARYIDLHITISPSLHDAVLRAYAGRPRRVVLVRLGIDLASAERSAADPRRVAEYRAAARRVIGTVARLVPQKAVHVLLDAAPALLRAEPSTRILIVGDGPLRSQLVAQAHRLGIAGAVTFAGYQGDTVSAYAAMDVFVLPSRDEGFGLVFLEAMAMGVPVVGTRVVGSQDAVEDGVTGLLVPFGDPAALAGAVLRLFADEQLRHRLCATASARVRRDHSRERPVKEIESLYRELMDRRIAALNGPPRAPVAVEARTHG